jgi:hypothetical protein
MPHTHRITLGNALRIEVACRGTVFEKKEFAIRETWGLLLTEST